MDACDCCSVLVRAHIVLAVENTPMIRTLSLVVFLAACQPIQPSAPVSPLAQPRAFYSPLVEKQFQRAYLPITIEGAIDRDGVCFNNPKALAFYRLLVADSRQKHTGLHCDERLVRAAQKRALGLSTVDPWGHVDRNGVWPNQYVRAEGCVLPSGYGERNNVESLSAGTGDVQAAFDSLALSEKHAPHLFGQGAFYQAQTGVGIGYATGGQYGFYWVFIAADCLQQ